MSFDYLEFMKETLKAQKAEILAERRIFCPVCQKWLADTEYREPAKKSLCDYCYFDFLEGGKHGGLGGEEKH